ncbi:hypothetical protein OG21DRAFT_560735 [Imleria badia]|nr:hypothetical protein OG21DRAFT_560735 [Imleria badia]
MGRALLHVSHAPSSWERSSPLAAKTALRAGKPAGLLPIPFVLYATNSLTVCPPLAFTLQPSRSDRYSRICRWCGTSSGARRLGPSNVSVRERRRARLLIPTLRGVLIQPSREYIFTMHGVSHKRLSSCCAVAVPQGHAAQYYFRFTVPFCSRQI